VLVIGASVQEQDAGAWGAALQVGLVNVVRKEPELQDRRR